jgi:hypothetical protein
LRALAFDPQNSNILYAAMGLAGGFKLIKSDDGGDSFPYEYAHDQQYICLSPHPTNGNIIFGGDRLKGVYKGTYAIKTTGDLNELSGYMAVTGDLIIKNTALRNLEGLECLSEIGGELVMENNSLLENIDGLSNLTSVASTEISYNPVLMNLDGFRKLASVEEYLFITSNDLLTNVNGLAAITSVDNLFINNNDTLVDLSGLSSLTSVNEQLVIIGNDELNDLNLDGLKTVGGLSLYGNVLLPPGQSREIIERLTGSIALENF